MKELIHANCLDILPGIINSHPKAIVVTDPPFNIGYHYGKYKDRMPEKEYFTMIGGYLVRAHAL